MMARADYEQHALVRLPGFDLEPAQVHQRGDRRYAGGPACSSCQLALDLREGGPA